jgi:hypothetical protein
MKGYLERIVSADKNARVHPLVGSMLVPAAEQGVAEVFSEERVVTSVDVPRRHKSARTSSPLAGQARWKDSRQADAASEKDLHGKPVEKTSPTVAARPTASETDHAGTFAIQNDQESGIEPSNPLVPELFDKEVEQKIVYRPLFPVETSALHASSDLRASGSRATVEGSGEIRTHKIDARKVEQTKQFHGVVEPSREPDEIHINIGRIELTAIHQIPPRTAAPARKSINLEEYLKRRGGRTG